LKIWEEFLDLAWGYSLWKLDRANVEKLKARKQADLDKLVQENKTPAERIAELQAELAAL
jgi:cell division protein FtsB